MGKMLAQFSSMKAVKPVFNGFELHVQFLGSVLLL